MSIEITMPRLSDTMEAGTIIKWNIKEGDTVSAGDVIADVETDKATRELAAFDDGTVTKIAVPEGKAVGVGTVIALLNGEGGAGEAAPKAKEKPKSKPGSEPPAEEKKAKPAAVESTADDEAESDEDDGDGEQETEAAKPERAKPAPTAVRKPSTDHRMKVSPVARLLAEEHDLDVTTIEGTGPGGRIIKRDVLQAIEAADETAAAVPPSSIARTDARGLQSVGVPATRVKIVEPDPDLPVGAPGAMKDRAIQLSGMRQTIAKRLVESKTTIPHYQVTATFNMDPLLDMRKQLNEQLESQGVKLSVNDFLVRCCALAMYRHPEFNASWAGDHIEIHGNINIGIAISIPAERGGGLVVASIRNADQKSLRVISFESKNFAEKARTRGLSVEDMSDSTFTISNLGMFGVDNFTAIINPPNSAILAVGAAIAKPVVRDGAITVGHQMTATLSNDHRVIDGAMAARYLGSLRDMLENPATLLV
jgi:pyruvate dehydrogenase E2 component (dihydrolipoamide acetyltransferase)